VAKSISKIIISWQELFSCSSLAVGAYVVAYLDCAVRVIVLYLGEINSQVGCATFNSSVATLSSSRLTVPQFQNYYLLARIILLF